MAAILVVDDDAAIRDLLYDLFAAEHLCHAAPTAERALEWLVGEPYDVILSDISMPGMSGLELLAHARRLQPDTPVVIISGIDYREHSGDLLRLGAFDYLVKPFGLDQAEEVVRRALDRRRRGA